MTGFLQCDDGIIYIQNQNVTKKSDFNKVRKHLGVCTQYDCLYDLITCYEHLELYAMLKGIHRTDLKTKINKLLVSVDLKGFEHIYSLNLKSDQKRQLCLAIALIDDPKILILDEPTTGMVFNMTTKNIHKPLVFEYEAKWEKILSLG